MLLSLSLSAALLVRSHGAHQGLGQWNTLFLFSKSNSRDSSNSDTSPTPRLYLLLYNDEFLSFVSAPLLHNLHNVYRRRRRYC